MSTEDQTQNYSKADAQTTELLMKEAEEYYAIAKSYRENKWRLDDEQIFVIDRKWIKKWKEYVNYAFIKRKMQYSYYYNNNKMKEYQVYENKRPGLIDNWNILVNPNEFLNDGNMADQMNLVVRSDLSQRDHIKICYKKVWEFFLNKYGGGPVINRSWITEGGTYSTRKVVELYYRSINLITIPGRTKISKELIHGLKPVQFYVSRTKNLNEMKDRYISIINHIYNTTFSNNNIQLWKINSNSEIDEFKDFLIKNLDDTSNTDSLISVEGILDYLEHIPKIALKDLEFADTETCIVEYFDDINPALFELKKVEMREGKCDWCNGRKILKVFCSCKEVGYCSENCKERDSHYHSSRCKKSFQIQEDSLKVTTMSKKGLVGLQNLGNTCFMNTSLQCISNCIELSEYFLKDYYKQHVNEDNPIGTQGVLARAYSNLLKNLWFGSSSVYSPWNFKSAIATFQSMFTGYQQHDTQEFLNYLLDGLHEDLNKVLKKPLVEKDDSRKLDSIKSKEQWIGFLRRNQSCLVDLLYGQYKSTLYCPDPECQNVSTTFDPFLSLTLPLASKSEKFELTCFFLFYDITISPIQIDLNFYSETSVMSLRNKMAKLLNIHPFSFIILRMDSFGDLDMIINSSMFVKVGANPALHRNQQAFFCFQIDTQVFYSNKSNRFNNIIESNRCRDFSQTFEELEKNKQEKQYLFQEEYDEDEGQKTEADLCYYSYVKNTHSENSYSVMKINTDDNYGMNEDWIKLILHMRKYDENTDLRKKLIFPRAIYINKKWSTLKLHLVIVDYFGPILRRFHSLPKSNNLWDTFFCDLEDLTMNKFDLTQQEHRARLFPYLIRIKNIFTEQGAKCVFCDRIDCNDCLLPCSESITVEQLLSRIPDNSRHSIDNTYHFMNEKQRNMSSIKDVDFTLDIAWLQQYIPEIRKMNEKKDLIMELNKTPSNERISIYNCFKNFCKIEKLEEDNEWFCPQCKHHQRADKKMEIYRSPGILIVHLKRFRNHSKIDTVIDFPINGLDITNFIMSTDNGIPPIYDLFAIANHYGSLSGGHYVAYAKNHLDKNWYCFNDSSVTKLSEDQLISSGAYVLFYKRRGLSEYLNLEEIYRKAFEDYENISEKDIKKLSLNSDQNLK